MKPPVKPVKPAEPTKLQVPGMGGVKSEPATRTDEPAADYSEFDLVAGTHGPQAVQAIRLLQQLKQTVDLDKFTSVRVIFVLPSMNLLEQQTNDRLDRVKGYLQPEDPDCDRSVRRKGMGREIERERERESERECVCVCRVWRRDLILL